MSEGEMKAEKIDFEKMSEVAKICFCEALAADEEARNRTLPPDFYQPPNGHEVLLVINGRQFSFEAILRLFDRQYDEQVRQAARAMAEEAVTLSPVVERLYALRHEIGEELDRLFPGTKREDGW